MDRVGIGAEGGSVQERQEVVICKSLYPSFLSVAKIREISFSSMSGVIYLPTSFK